MVVVVVWHKKKRRRSLLDDDTLSFPALIDLDQDRMEGLKGFLPRETQSEESKTKVLLRILDRLHQG